MSYWQFCTGNISSHSFILGQAFHQPCKPSFSWFAWVIACYYPHIIPKPVLSFASDKAELFSKNFPKNSSPFFPSSANLKLHNIFLTHRVVKSCVCYATFLLVWFLSQNKSTCQTRKNIFISLQKLFSLLRKLNFRIMHFQISWRHQMLRDKTRNTFYWITREISTAC